MAMVHLLSLYIFFISFFLVKKLSFTKEKQLNQRNKASKARKGGSLIQDTLSKIDLANLAKECTNEFPI